MTGHECFQRNHRERLRIQGEVPRHLRPGRRRRARTRGHHQARPGRSACCYPPEKAAPEPDSMFGCHARLGRASRRSADLTEPSGAEPFDAEQGVLCTLSGPSRGAAARHLRADLAGERRIWTRARRGRRISRRCATGGLLVSVTSAWEIGLLSRAPGRDCDSSPIRRPGSPAPPRRPASRVTAITPEIAIELSHLPGDSARRPGRPAHHRHVHAISAPRS